MVEWKHINESQKDKKRGGSSTFCQYFGSFYPTKISIFLFRFFPFAKIVSGLLIIRLSVRCNIQFFIYFIYVGRLRSSPPFKLVVGLSQVYFSVGDMHLFVVFIGKTKLNQVRSFPFLHFRRCMSFIINFFTVSFESLHIFNIVYPIRLFIINWLLLFCRG